MLRTSQWSRRNTVRFEWRMTAQILNSVGIDHETIANVGTRNKRIKPLSVERILAVIDSVELGLTRIFMIDHNITSPPLGDRVCPT